MTITAHRETLGFQAEVKQLLHLMIHSLYSNKEIFLRELISNASDAADKLRFEALSNGALWENDPELKINIECDKALKTITLMDNGIGMTRQEVIDHLGTIAKSGTAEFLQHLTGDQKKDANLIGQFGVGFYSAFIVSRRVEVFTRKAGLSASEGARWTSEGQGQFTIESMEKKERGTTIVLHLKDEEAEFAEGFKLRSIIRKYSDHISIPIVMQKEDFSADKDKEKEKDKKKEPEYETVNKATALWARSRTDIQEEEYKEFYKHVSHDFEDPLVWSHNKVEGKLEYTSLLYIPAKAPFDLWHREASPRGLKLYVQRVFIMDDADQFLPLYLRFVKGVIDSNNLSLNVSREILQTDATVSNIRSALTKRVLDMLEKLAKNEADKYQNFWDQFGLVMKEGPAEDFSNKEAIAKLLRFSTTHTNVEKQDQSLADYVARMKEGQEKIYYTTAENFNAAKNSPHLEIFRKKGIEVVLLFDRVDEWLMSYLNEFDKKQFQHVAKGALDLGKLEDKDDQQEQKKQEKEYKALTDQIKKVLEDKIKEVRVTHRLTDSPACIVVDEHDMGLQMQRILQMAGQKVPDTKPIFEVNPHHPLVKKLNDEQDMDRFKDLTFVLFDQASLAEGRSLADPASYVQRLNKLLLELTH